MTKEQNIFKDSINEARAKLIFKCEAFNNAYIYVLESSSLALESLGVLLSDDLPDGRNKKIAIAYSRLQKSLNSHGICNEDYYLALLFIDLISSTEIFFIDLIKIILEKNPKKIGNIQFSIGEILDSSSTDELILKASEMYINKLLYKKPYDYLADISSVLSIDKSIIEPYWASYIEAKARRDIGVHNNWICNSTYCKKLQEAGISSNSNIGDSLLPPYEGYASEIVTEIMNMTSVMKEAVFEKHL